MSMLNDIMNYAADYFPMLLRKGAPRFVTESGKPVYGIVAEFDVPFDYPRSPDLRFDPEFAKLSGEVSQKLRGSHS